MKPGAFFAGHIEDMRLWTRNNQAAKINPCIPCQPFETRYDGPKCKTCPGLNTQPSQEQGSLPSGLGENATAPAAKTSGKTGDSAGSAMKGLDNEWT